MYRETAGCSPKTLMPQAHHEFVTYRTPLRRVVRLQAEEMLVAHVLIQHQGGRPRDSRRCGGPRYEFGCRSTEVFSLSEIHISFSSPGMSRGWASMVVKPRQRSYTSSSRLLRSIENCGWASSCAAKCGRTTRLASLKAHSAVPSSSHWAVSEDCSSFQVEQSWSRLVSPAAGRRV